jgi:hypothetical protein
MGLDKNFPRTLEEWLANRGAKLDAVVKILDHHIRTINAPPLKVVEEEETNTLVPNPDHPLYEPVVHPMAPKTDKIVLFAQFTGMFPVIKNVRDSYLSLCAQDSHNIL